MASPTSSRLDGLDLARFLAFFGMVVVNFKIVMLSNEAVADAVYDGGTYWLATVTSLLEGKAAATFVVLAGVGLGLSSSRSAAEATRLLTLRRSLFLLVVGLLNTLIFDADILHYYAFYFFLGMFCLHLPTRNLMQLTAAIIFGFALLLVFFDYDAGWNWSNLTYTGFWTVEGFIRNLLFNGWHPVIPWLAFFLWGIVISRWRLDRRETQLNMILAGGAVVVVVGIFSWGAVVGHSLANMIEADLISLLMTSPIPPTPFFMIMGMAVATTVIGICLAVAGFAGQSAWFSVLTAPGRQTLTLYVGHILIGMGTLEELGMLGNQDLETSALASVCFCAAAMIYAAVWGRFFKRGPVEMLMRKLAG